MTMIELSIDAGAVLIDAELRSICILWQGRQRMTKDSANQEDTDKHSKRGKRKDLYGSSEKCTEANRDERSESDGKERARARD